jgi:hypothetical protein
MPDPVQPDHTQPESTPSTSSSAPSTSSTALSATTAARIVGLLFVTTMLAGMADAYTVAPLLDGSFGEVGLGDVSRDEGRVLTGALCVLYMALGVVGIALVMFPVLRRHDETVAITYVALRTVEGVLLTTGTVAYLVLVSMSRDLPAGDAPAAVLWAVTIKLGAYQVAMVVLGLSGVLFCRSLGTARLVPRPLALWGVVGYVLLFASAVLDVLDTTGAGALLYVPGAVWELFAFPGWLFVKGFGAQSLPEDPEDRRTALPAR